LFIRAAYTAEPGERVPLLTPVARSGWISPPQCRFRNKQQISRGKRDCFQRATAGSTTGGLDGYGLRDHMPARSAPCASVRFLFAGSRFCSALLSDLQ